MLIRPVVPEDLDEWLPLWHGYNAFYGREGATALPDEVTDVLWSRFFAADEPVYGLVATDGDRLLGLTNYLFHRSTTQIAPSCYLQDLFTAPDARGQGVGRALIEGVYGAADEAGAARVYWLTHETNEAGRSLYDKVAEHAGFIAYARTS